MEGTVGGVIARSFVAQHDWSTSSSWSVGDGDVMHEEGPLAHEAAASSIMDQEEENSGLKASSRTDSGVFDSRDQTPVCSFQRGGFMEMMDGCESSPASCTSSTHPSPAAHRRNADASAATVLKWQQLLRDHPNDPMVPPSFLPPSSILPPTFSHYDISFLSQFEAEKPSPRRTTTIPHMLQPCLPLAALDT